MAVVSKSISEEERVSRAIITAVAGIEDTDPSELSPPLYDAVDPEALDRFAGSIREDQGGEWHLSFRYLDYEISVFAEDETVVQLHEPDE